MNFKKFKRLLSVALSASMLLSTNMTALATETTAPVQADTAVEQETHQHSWQLEQELKPAACDEAGIAIYGCDTEGCGETKEEAIEALGHDFVTKDGATECNRCGHTVNTSASNDAAYSAAEGNAEEHEHTYTKVSKKDPTCWSEGYMSHYECSECGKLFVNQGSYVEITLADVTISKLDHQAKRKAAQNADNCTEAIKEYYYCASASDTRKYETLEKFNEGAQTEGTENIDWFKEESSFKVNNNGHVYDISKDYEVDWNAVTVEGYDGTNPTETDFKRSCSNEGCTHTESAEKVEVTKENGKGYNCAAVSPVTYTVKGTFANDLFGTPVTGDDKKTTITKSKTISKPAGEHEAFTLKFDWSDFKPTVKDGKLANYSDGVTAKYICNVCQAEKPVADLKVTISVKSAQEEGADAPIDNIADATITCGKNVTINFEATATGTGITDQTTVNEATKQYIVHAEHNLTFKPGKKATCTTAGTRSYFECSVCKKTFADEEAAEEIKDTEIEALGHSFGVPSFSWQNPVVKKDAMATFKCVRCPAENPASVIIPNLTVDFTKGIYREGDATKTCGQTVILSYPVEVLFDRELVKDNGNGSYTYNPDSAAETDALLYKGYVEKENILLHDFTVTTAWNGEADKDGVYNPANGLKATISCSRCNGSVVMDSKTGAVQGSGTIANPTGTITLGEKSSTSSTCTEAGKDTYPVTIKIEDTTGQYDLSVNADNIIPAKGHNYLEQIVWDGETFDSNKLPEITKVTLTCAEGDSTLDSEKGDIRLSIEATTSANLGYVAATCSNSGMDAWKVTAAHDGGSEILHVNKESAKLGHDFTGKPEWDWTAFGGPDPYNPSKFLPKPGITTETAEVYASYKCSHEKCDLVTPAGTETGVTYITNDSSKRLVKKVKSKVTENVTGADCETDGSVVYTAAAGKDKDTKTGDYKSKGHNWEETITWSAWEKVLDENGEPVTMVVTKGTGDEAKQITVPVYQITASAVCQNENCPLENQKISVTAKTNDTLTDEQKLFSHIETAVEIPDGDINPCEDRTNITYRANAVFFDNEGEKISFSDETSKKETTVSQPALGHKFVLEWTWYGKIEDKEEAVEVTEENADTITEYTGAKLVRYCAHEGTGSKVEGTAPDTNATPNNTLTTTTVPEGAIQSCTQDVTKHFDANITLSGIKYNDRKSITKIATGHKEEWILENVNWGSVTETPQTVRAVKWCVYELAEDFWTKVDDEGYNVEGQPTLSQVKNVTVKKDTARSVLPTCSKPGKNIWTITPEDGSEIQLHEETVGINENAHAPKGAASIKWDTLTATEKDADGMMEYTVKAVQPCLYGDHTYEADGKAKADLSKIDCEQEQSVTYTFFGFPKGITLDKGNTQEQVHDAAGHDFKRYAAKTEGDTCATYISYPSHYHCKRCGRNYQTADAEIEVEVSYKAQGHLYNAPTFQWISEGKTAEAVFVCGRKICQETAAGHTKTFLATTKSVFVDIEPTCEKNGQAYHSFRLDLTSLADKTGLPVSSQAAPYVYTGEIGLELPKAGHELGTDGTCTWCKKKYIPVTFLGRTGTIFVKYCSPDSQNAADQTIAIGEIPVAPNQGGYQFINWSIGSKTYTSDQKTQLVTDINAEVKKGNAVTVQANYNQLTNKVNVTVSYGGLTNAPVDQTTSVEIGTNFKVEADATIMDGTTKKYFSHWSDKAENGTTLGTGLTYEVYVQKEVTVYAIYTATAPDDEKESEPEIYITSIAKADADGVSKIAFTATMSIPEGYSMVSSGFYYGTTEACPNKKEINGIKTNTLTIKVEGKESTTVYAKGYLTYRNDKTNETVTIETDVASKAHDDFPQ